MLHFMESPSGIKVHNAFQGEFGQEQCRHIVFACTSPAECALLVLMSTQPISWKVAAVSKRFHVLQIVFNTDQNVGNLQDHLGHIYSNLYVEYVMKNPLYEPGQPFR